jgi:hypothetical protein
MFATHRTGEPQGTLEPQQDRKALRNEGLLDLVLEHYDELNRLIDLESKPDDS